MEEQEDQLINSDINFQRAMLMLHKQIDSPKFLIAYWRAVGDMSSETPWVEKVDPWYKGLEEFLFMP